jgi:hypothetical protein
VPITYIIIKQVILSEAMPQKYVMLSEAKDPYMLFAPPKCVRISGREIPGMDTDRQQCRDPFASLRMTS